MNVLFDLPDVFRCPICNSTLKYGETDYGVHMISCCNGWNERNNPPKCYSPWRKKGNDFPYHVWVAHDVDGKLLPQLTNGSHIHKDEEQKRVVFAEELDLKLKIDYPEIYKNILYREGKMV